MRILQILSSRSPGGGSQEHTRFLSRGLKDRGHEVTLVTRPGRIVDWFKKEGLEVIPLELRDRKRAVRILTRLIEERRFEVVHTHNRDGDIPGIIAGRRTGIPLVITTIHAFLNRDKEGNPKMNFPLWKYNRLLRKGPHFLVALSEALRKQMLEEVGIDENKIRVILNALDTTRLKPRRSFREVIREVRGEGRIIVGGVGSLIRLKGYQYLVRSARRVVRLFPNVLFLILGDGNYREELEKMVEEMGLRDNFLFTGKVEHPPDYLQVMDIFVHPSLSEGMPRAVMEAMGMGLPVVVSEVGGVPELVREGEEGILVPPGNPSALSRAMVYLLRNPSIAKRMGERGKKRIYLKFRAERMVEEMESFYQEALSQTPYPLHD